MNSPFAIPAFRRMFLAQIISISGTGITTIALALMAWEINGKQAGQILGTVLAIKMLIYVFLSPIISAYSQRFDRRKWLVAMDIMRAALIISLPWIDQVWQIYGVLSLVYICAAGYTPVFQATLAEIVPEKESYQRALSYSRIAFDLEQILSPLVAALLLGFISFSGLFILDGLSFTVSALLLFTVKLSLNKQATEKKFHWKQAWFGMKIYFKTPRLQSLLLMYITVACASSMVIVNTVLFIREELQGDEQLTSLAYAASGVGAIASAFLIPRLLQRFTIRQVTLTGCALLSSGLWICYNEINLITFLVTWIIFGIGLSMVQTPAGMLIRNSCQSEDSPALFSAQFSLSHACWLLTYLIAGYVGAFYGFATSSLVLGIIASTAFIIAWFRYPNPDPEEIEHTHNYPSEDHHRDHPHNHPSADNSNVIVHRHRYVIDHEHQHWPDAK